MGVRATPPHLSMILQWHSDLNIQQRTICHFISISVLSSFGTESILSLTHSRHILAGKPEGGSAAAREDGSVMIYEPNPSIHPMARPFQPWSRCFHEKMAAGSGAHVVMVDLAGGARVLMAKVDTRGSRRVNCLSSSDAFDHHQLELGRPAKYSSVSICPMLRAQESWFPCRPQQHRG